MQNNSESASSKAKCITSEQLEPYNAFVIREFANYKHRRKNKHKQKKEGKKPKNPQNQGTMTSFEYIFLNI